MRGNSSPLAGLAGLSCPLKLTTAFTLTPAAEITWTDGWVRPVSGLKNIPLRLTGTWKLYPQVAVAPFAACNIPLETTRSRYSEEFISGGALHLKFRALPAGTADCSPQVADYS